MPCEASKQQQTIYLDGFATTPLSPEAREAMFAAWSLPGNAGSPHRAGTAAARVVSDARVAVATLIGASPAELVFTSGATEANNLAITGIARQALLDGQSRRSVIVSAIEHKAVLEPAYALESLGFEVIVAPVDATGRVDLNALAQLINDATLFVSVMAANNETGILQPIAEVAALARQAGALVHCDAAQAAGKIPIDVVALDLDYVSLSGHKLYGPMGVGALYVSATAPRPQPLHRGGGQEQGLRSGTEPVPLLAGFGAAARIAASRLDEDARHGLSLARRLQHQLAERQVRHTLTTCDAAVLPGSLSISLFAVDADEIVLRVANEVCLSTGSACNRGQVTTSHVFASMGYSEIDARHILRIFCGRYNTLEEIDRAASIIASAVRRSALAPGDLRQ